MRNKMIRLFTILLLSSLAFSLSAQTRNSKMFRIAITADVSARFTIQSRDDRSMRPVNGTTNAILTLPGGTYNIEIVAPGFDPQRRVITLDRNKEENFAFRSQRPAPAANVRVNITSNVNGARIQINGPQNITGAAPMRAELPAGRYNVTITATGYMTKTDSINLQRNQNLHFNLDPAVATVQVVIPTESMNRTTNNPLSMVTVYDNGILMNGTVFSIQPGQHTIQVISGGFATQATFVAEGGRTYTIKPVFSLIIE